MATNVQCPYCGSYNTAKTTNGKFSRGIEAAASLVGGTLLQMATGGSRYFRCEFSYGQIMASILL